MDELKVCRLSAEALGKAIETDAAPKDAVWIQGPNGERWVHWNPLTNAEQRWECVEFMMRGDSHRSLIIDSEKYHEWYRWDSRAPISIKCPAAEFPARAVAEIRVHDRQCAEKQKPSATQP